MNVAAALLTGYLLGSMLPAYLIGKARGVDLQHAGSGNAGATNALHMLGPGPAAVTVAYDALKGVLAMLIAWKVFGVGEAGVYAAGIAAWVGHHYPFYLGYHGAEGAATSAGLLTAAVLVGLYRGWFAAIDVGIVVAAMTLVLALSGSWPIAGIAGLCLGLPLMVYRSHSFALDVLASFAVIHQLVHNVTVARERAARNGSSPPAMRRGA